MKIYKDSLFGRVCIRKNARAKRIILRVKPLEGIVITIPKRATYSMAINLLEEQKDWVLAQQKKQQEERPFIDYNTRFDLPNRPIIIVSTSQKEWALVYDKDKIEVAIPLKWMIKARATQETIISILVEILRQEAKKYLLPRTQKIATKKGIKINNIRIKKVKTRWGSCSSLGNINLSLYLMLLPVELIDYVIYHELAHIQHQNHSSAFWLELERLLPNSKRLDKRLNQYKIPF